MPSDPDEAVGDGRAQPPPGSPRPPASGAAPPPGPPPPPASAGPPRPAHERPASHPPPDPAARLSASEGAPAGDLTQPPRRLHPFGIVRGLNLRSALTTVPALLIVGSQADLGLALLTVAVVAVGVVARVIAWSRHTYELRGGRIVERSGIISRTERTLEIERIQQIDVERTLLDRAVGTCELRLETAADSGESELTLTVVTVEEAERLRSLLASASARLAASAGTTAASTGVGGADDDHVGPARDRTGRADPARTGSASRSSGAVAEEQVVDVPLRHVVFAALTGPRLLVVPAGLAFVIGTVFEVFEPDPDTTSEVATDAFDLASGLGALAVVGLAVGVVLVALTGAAVVGVLRDGGFEIVRRHREIVVRRGLTTTRTATVPLRRVQRVSVKRSWIHGLAGFATMTIHTAGSVGGGAQSDGQSRLDRSLTVPLLPEDDVPRLLDVLLGTSEVPRLERHPRPARRRLVLRALGGTLTLAVPVMSFAVLTERVPLGATVVAVLAALAIAIGVGRYTRLATGIGEQLVAGRTGLLGTRTVLAPRGKVQGVSVTTTWFQRRRQLATASVHVAGPSGGVELRDLGTRTAAAVAQSLV